MAETNRSVGAIKQRKDELRTVLQRMVGRVPKAVANGSINLTREWKDAHKQALKACGPRGSEADLTSALSNLRRFES